MLTFSGEGTVGTLQEEGALWLFLAAARSVSSGVWEYWVVLWPKHAPRIHNPLVTSQPWPWPASIFLLLSLHRRCKFHISGSHWCYNLCASPWTWSPAMAHLCPICTKADASCSPSDCGPALAQANQQTSATTSFPLSLEPRLGEGTPLLSLSFLSPQPTERTEFYFIL